MDNLDQMLEAVNNGSYKTALSCLDTHLENSSSIQELEIALPMGYILFMFLNEHHPIHLSKEFSDDMKEILVKGIESFKTKKYEIICDCIKSRLMCYAVEHNIDLSTLDL